MSLLIKRINKRFKDIAGVPEDVEQKKLNKADNHVMVTSPESFISNGHPLLRELSSRDPATFHTLYDTYVEQIKSMAVPLPKDKSKLGNGIYYATNNKSLAILSFGENRDNFTPLQNVLDKAANKLLNLELSSSQYSSLGIKSEVGIGDRWVNRVLGVYAEGSKTNISNDILPTQLSNSATSGVTAFKLARAMKIAKKSPNLVSNINTLYDELSGNQIDYTLKVDEVLTSRLSRLDISYTVTQPQSDSVKKEQNKRESQIASKLSNLAGEIANTKGSRSFNEYIDYAITNAIFDKPIKPQVIKGTSKTVSNTKNPVKIVRKPKVKSLKRMKPYRNIAPVNFSPFRVSRLINETLAQTIRDNMGESSDEPILLRNQTGRFSKSAELLTLTRTTANTLLGTYTYQRNPYDVFLPGGKLHTQVRDPRLYIEGSIRESALKILGKNFPGLRLELV